MQVFNKVLAFLICGILALCITSVVAGGLAALVSRHGGLPAVEMAAGGAVLLTGALVFRASTARRAWGRGSLLVGLLLVLMPVAAPLWNDLLGSIIARTLAQVALLATIKYPRFSCAG